MKVTVLGVPSSAGAYCVGVERAPAALRQAGLFEALRASGAEVVDAGDLTTRLWMPDLSSPFAQNIVDEADSVAELSAAAADLLAEGERCSCSAEAARSPSACVLRWRRPDSAHALSTWTGISI